MVAATEKMVETLDNFKWAIGLLCNARENISHLFHTHTEAPPLSPIGDKGENYEWGR